MEEKIDDDYLKHIAVRFMAEAFDKWCEEEESEEN